MKFIDTLKQPRWLIPICVLGYLIVMGIVAENQPWGRGWIHDLKHIQDRRAKGIHPDAYPDDDDPEVLKLQQEINEWIPQILEQYPGLKVKYKNVPNDQNGFLKILEWQEKFISLEEAANQMALPSDINDIFASLLSVEKNTVISDEKIRAAKVYLESKKDILDRAIIIGLLPEQSIANISPDRHFPMNIFFAKNITDHLKLKAIMEARRGELDAAFRTLKATRGWGDHYGNVETPTLIASTLSIANHLSVQNMTYSQVLPLLADKNLDYAQWRELMIYDHDVREKWTHLFRGEWHAVFKSRWAVKSLVYENPRDTRELITAYASAIHDLNQSEILIESGFNKSIIPNHLTRKSRELLEVLFLGTSAYGKGFLRAQAILRQHEIAFTLQRLEAEGQELGSLDQKVVDTLPLQILPDLKLSIDFDKRLITAPTEIPDAKPLTF